MRRYEHVRDSSKEERTLVTCAHIAIRTWNGWLVVNYSFEFGVPFTTTVPTRISLPILFVVDVMLGTPIVTLDTPAGKLPTCLWFQRFKHRVCHGFLSSCSLVQQPKRFFLTILLHSGTFVFCCINSSLSLSFSLLIESSSPYSSFNKNLCIF